MEITFTLLIMSIKFKRKFNWTEKRTSKSLEDRQNNKNLVQEKMWRQLNKQWEISLITKEDKFKQFILILKKEELLQSHQLLTIWEEKLHNGRSGIVTLMNSKERKNKTRNKKIKNIITIRKTPNKSHKEADIQSHLRDVWKSCKEWSDKTNKTRSTINTDTIGKRVKNKEDHKVNYYPFGD